MNLINLPTWAIAEELTTRLETSHVFVPPDALRRLVGLLTAELTRIDESLGKEGR